MWTVISGNHSSSAGKIVKVAIIYAETAESVADDFDLDPGAGPLGESFHVTPTNRAAVEDIGFEMYALLRRTDSCQFSFVEKISIRKNLETGVPVGFGIGEGFQYAEELSRVVPQGFGRTDVVPEIGRGETTEDLQGYRRDAEDRDDHEGYGNSNHDIASECIRRLLLHFIGATAVRCYGQKACRHSLTSHKTLDRSDVILPLMPPSIATWKPFFVSLLLGLLGSGLLLLMLAEFHEEIAEPFLMHMDLQIQGTMHGCTSVALTKLMFGLTRIGSPAVLFPLTALIAMLFWWKHLRRDALVFLIAMVGAGSLNTLLKLYFHRARPDVLWALALEHSFSFPSGHSVFAVVLYGMLLYFSFRYLRHAWQRAGIIVVATALIAGIGLSRIYLGVHYPSDVAAGYLVGCTWLVTVVGSDWNLRRMERQHETC